MSNEKKREAFEAWARDSGQFFSNYCRCDDGSYDDQELNSAWHGYQAAIAATQRDAMAVAEAVRGVCAATQNSEIGKLNLAAIVEAVQPGQQEAVNQWLLAALKRYDIEVEGTQIYRVGSPDGRYVLFDDVAAIAAAEAAQPVAYGKTPGCKQCDEAEACGLTFCPECDAQFCEGHDGAEEIDAKHHASAQQQGDPVAWRNAIKLLVSEYWDIGYQEGKTGQNLADKANDVLSRLDAALTAPPAPACSVPDGWRLVPVEPTEEMIRGACLAQSSEKYESYESWWDDHSSGVSERIRSILVKDYHAMLAAAPKPEGGA